MEPTANIPLMLLRAPRMLVTTLNALHFGTIIHVNRSPGILIIIYRIINLILS